MKLRTTLPVTALPDETAEPLDGLISRDTVVVDVLNDVVSDHQVVDRLAAADRIDGVDAVTHVDARPDAVDVRRASLVQIRVVAVQDETVDGDVARRDMHQGARRWDRRWKP